MRTRAKAYARSGLTRTRTVAVGQTKSGKVRSVPLSDLATEWLGGLLRQPSSPHSGGSGKTGNVEVEPKWSQRKSRETEKSCAAS